MEQIENVFDDCDEFGNTIEFMEYQVEDKDGNYIPTIEEIESSPTQSPQKQKKPKVKWAGWSPRAGELDAKKRSVLVKLVDWIVNKKHEKVLIMTESKVDIK